MGLTFGEAARIEQKLAEAGELDDILDPEVLFDEIGAWFANERQRGAPIVDNESFAILCDYARRSADGRVKSLAMGALRLARDEGETSKDRARFTIRFALHRIRTLVGDEPHWGAIPLSAEEEADARALFEAALGDSSYTDTQLFDAANDFIEEYRGGGHLFGRLASDLSFLVKTLDDDKAVTEHEEIARAALTYFAVVADAIPDDLGLVGLLDDVFVVQSAVEEIRPERRPLIAFLDGILRRWPFVRDVVFDVEGTPYPVSEFMLVNVALLLAISRRSDDVGGAALMIPETGPLPFVLGFMRSLAEVGSRVKVGADAFTSGERLVNRETGAEVVFDSYGRLVGTAFDACSAEDATHFRFQRGEGKTARSAVSQIRRIEDVWSFRRSGKREGGLKSGKLAFDLENFAMGPLERLLASPTPIILSDQRRCVVVVSPIQATREVAKSLRIFGKSFAEALPMGQAALRGDEIQRVAWTQREVGGRQMLTVVRSTADALVLAEDMGDECIGVVAPVRQGSTDTVNLGRIRASGIPVVAILNDRDTDAHEHLEKLGFNFWSWEEPWVSGLHWPDQASADRNLVAAFEQRMRFRSESRVSATSIELRGLAEAYEALRTLPTGTEEDTNEVLDLFVSDCFAVLLRICRFVSPLDAQTAEEVQNRLEQIDLAVKQNAIWWPDEVLSVAQRIPEALEESLSSLSAVNPKFEAIAEWTAGQDSGVIICQRRMADALAAHVEDSRVDIQVQPRSGVLFANVLVPAWLGRDRMDRFLSPPLARETELVLYQPEMDWYAAFVRRQSLRREQIRHLANDRPTFPSLRPSMKVQRTSIPVATRPEIDPDAVVQRSRRAQATRSMGPGGDEPVEARLIYFAGGHWGAYTASHRVHTVTHLLGRAASAASDDTEIHETTSWQLRHGDLVLVMLGSDRDALREAVDAVAPEGARDAAAKWRLALSRYLDRGHSIGQLVAELAAAGCVRAEDTVRGWIENEAIIGPMRGGPDIEAITRATGDEELMTDLSTCTNAVSMLRGLHLRVAHTLAQRVLEEAQQWLEAGVEPDELVQIEDRLVLVTVETVDPVSVVVPRAAANRLQEEL